MSTAVYPSFNQDIDGVLWGWKWSFTNLTYGFATSAAAYSYSAGINGFEEFNSIQKSAFTKAIRNIDDVCGLTITFAANAANANLRGAEVTTVNYLDGTGTHVPGNNPPVQGTAEGVPPDPVFQNGVGGHPDYAQGDTWFNHDFYNTPRPGTFHYAAGILHELGHAVGLKHGQNSQFVTHDNLTFPGLPTSHDNQNYSVMTYSAFAHNDGGFNQAEYPSTLMQDDIAALQYLYGADFTTRAGNTTYKWNPVTGELAINRAGQGASFHNKIFMTIWDGGGSDTYDFSSYKTNVSVNLAPGGWSTPSAAQVAILDNLGHHAKGSIANALLFNGSTRSLIENASTGSGNDKILGNVAANRFLGNNGNDKEYGFGGNDSLFGGNGNDYLFGGDGNDTLHGNAGNDKLYGGAGKDKIYGDTGSDQFLFTSRFDSSSSLRDTVYGFTHSDKIILSSIDANIRAAGNQAFKVVSHFTGHAGEIQFDRIGGSLYYVNADLNGDRHADFGFNVSGVTSLTKADFIL